MSLPRYRTYALLAFLAAAGIAGSPWAGWADEAAPPKHGPAKEKPKKEHELKKYADVITSAARTTPGVFTVHRVDEKVYYEIPPDVYGKLMLWTTEVAKAPAGIGWGGSALGNRVVRWDRRGNKVYLWQMSFEKHGDGKAIQRAVD